VSEALLDRVAIIELVSRYCRGIDRRDFALVRSLYHDDARENHGAMFSGSPDEFVAWLADFMPVWDATIHTIGNSVVVVDGDRAEGEHQVRAWHRSQGPDRKEYAVHGRYLDRYERRDGVWKFSERAIVFDHGTMRDVDEDAIAQLGGDAAHGRADRDDPSWNLPLLAGLGGQP
jgi:hypothetical protein